MICRYNDENIFRVHDDFGCLLYEQVKHFVYAKFKSWVFVMGCRDVFHYNSLKRFVIYASKVDKAFLDQLYFKLLLLLFLDAASIQFFSNSVGTEKKNQ